MSGADKLISYGVPTDLAKSVSALNLTVNVIRATSRAELVDKYRLKDETAKFLKDAVQRQPIPGDRLHALLSNSNFTCCVCHGTKSDAYLVHHITAYSSKQSNAYENLAVLCPTCHDKAHHRAVLSRSLSESDIRRSKQLWEETVALQNAHRASLGFKVTHLGIDYVNVRRLEALCMDASGLVPRTSATAELQDLCVLNECGAVDMRAITSDLSNGRFPFDFPSISTSNHWIELVKNLDKRVSFENLDTVLNRPGGLNFGPCGMFIVYTGYVTGSSVTLPLPSAPALIRMNGRTGNVRLEFTLDPNFVLSNTAFGRIAERNLYSTYLYVTSVEKGAEDENGVTLIGIPLLMAQPSGYVGLSNEPDIERH